MIELRDCIVGVKDEKEYEKVIQIAKEQGCEWNSGDSLDYIYCTFPTRLEFNRKYETYWGSSRGRCARDYPRYLDIIKGVRRLIMVRKET